MSAVRRSRTSQARAEVNWVMPLVQIIIPTHNEKGNIPVLFRRIQDSLKGSDYGTMVVDDSSPDGTAQEVLRHSEGIPVRLIVRQKRTGLASAVAEGLSASDAEILVVMDADLQHPPEKIPELVEEIKKGADIVIASRKIEGGSMGGLSHVRRLISWGADSLARALFDELEGIGDIESGSFALRKRVVEGVELRPVGYKILLEILVLGEYDTVKEVGYQFASRTAGESKLGVSTVFSYVDHLLILSWRSGKLLKFAKFCTVGLIGTGVNLGVLYALTNLGLYYLLSGLVAIEVSILTNFFLNRAWSFAEEASSTRLVEALAKDHLVRSGGCVISYVCLWVLTEFFGMYYLISMIIGIGLSTIWNFKGNVRWVWKKR